MDGSQM
jgi:hypothetical protein